LVQARVSKRIIELNVARPRLCDECVPKPDANPCSVRVENGPQLPQLRHSTNLYFVQGRRLGLACCFFCSGSLPLCQLCRLQLLSGRNLQVQMDIIPSMGQMDIIPSMGQMDIIPSMGLFRDCKASDLKSHLGRILLCSTPSANKRHSRGGRGMLKSPHLG
jgi:hypothetical protein